MPMHNGFLPREGFVADVVLKLVRNTALNPALLLPLVLLARFTKQGQNFSVLHPAALSRFRTLFYVAIARSLSMWYSDQVRNNWTSDNYDWSREIVLVTGGAGGIGGSIVKLFEELGVTTVVLDVLPMSFKTSDKVHYFQCDLRSPTKVAAVAETIKAKVGNPTVIINNAGVARGKTILEAQPSDLRFTFDVNTLAPMYVIKAFLPAMVAANHGMVVTVSSFAAWLSAPGMVDYSASKAATMAVHEGLTAELKTHYKAPKVRTVIVHPGHVKTLLFSGFNQNSDFLFPPQEPDSLAEAIVRAVMKGRTGSIVLPELGSSLPGVRAMPDWYSFRVRAKLASVMTNFTGRQVIKDVDAAVDEDGTQQSASQSTVLVSNEDAREKS